MDGGGSEQVIQTFDEWVKARYLRRENGDSSKDRLAKNWYGLVSSVKPKGLFDSFPKPGGKVKLYGIHLPPSRLMSHLPELPQVLLPRV